MTANEGLLEFDYLRLGPDDKHVMHFGQTWRACKHCGVLKANHCGYTCFVHAPDCPLGKRHELSARLLQDAAERGA